MRCFFVICLACFSNAMIAATVQVEVSATVIPAVTITKNTDLSFGSFGPSMLSSGAIVVSPTGWRTSSGGDLSFGGSDQGNAATFSLTGNQNATFSISIPASVVISSGVNNMLVDSFTTKLSNSYSSAQTMLLGVGATIHVQKNQAVGKYAGNFALTVDYQ